MVTFDNLSDLLRSDEFATFQESKLGNDLFISDPDRADRIAEGAEAGVDGSTHGEHIDDWREFLDTLRIIDPDDEDQCGDISQAVYDSISKEIDETENWHAKNGSLEQTGA